MTTMTSNARLMNTQAVGALVASIVDGAAIALGAFTAKHGPVLSGGGLNRLNERMLQDVGLERAYAAPRIEDLIR